MKAFGKSALGVILLSAGLFGPAASASADECRDAPRAGIDWQNCDKRLLMLEDSDLANARLAGADFTTTDLRNSVLTGAKLEKSKLVRAKLAGASAKGTNFARVEAYRTDFSAIKANEASFESAELQRSDFQKASLKKANFTKADLGRSDFGDADIGGSRFSLSNLARADFRGAKFSGPVDFDRAFFFLTRIEGADLTAATGLSQWQLDMACGNDSTVLPSGLSRPKSWPCKFDQD